MTETSSTERLNFLAKKFDIFETTPEKVKLKISELRSQGFIVVPIEAKVNKISHFLALVYMKEKLDGSSQTKQVCVSSEVFNNMVAADPTPNKSCVQWMLNTFTRSLTKPVKEGEDGEAHAKRFVAEDLPQANAYITLFEANKRKKKFASICAESYTLKDIEDPTDINQYRSLSELYDAVDPFIERKATELESLLKKYVDVKQALIPIRDRKYTLYIPLTADASTIFGKFASWCTARPENSMFSNYTDQKTPMGTKSHLFIIINNKFFTGESQELYQVHFESKQLKDRQNSTASNLINTINDSEGLKKYFHDELLILAKAKKSMDNNLYLEYLMDFGFCNSVFELLESDTASIQFMDKVIKEIPDLTRFKVVDEFIVTNGELTNVHESIGKLVMMESLILRTNKLKTLPKEIGNLKKLEYINLLDNPIEDLPEEIKYLDRSNGGSLRRISLGKDKIGVDLIKKLKRLLPKIELD